MPITFQSRHSPRVVMLDRVGREMLGMMGLSGTVPGALAPQDIARALARLEQAVAAEPARPSAAERDAQAEDTEREPAVPVAHRALPLIELLKQALRDGEYVTWDH